MNKGQNQRVSEKRLHTAMVVLLDVLLAGAILLVYFFFQLFLPAMRAADKPPVHTPVPTVSAELSPEPLDDRTPWQKRFEEHFSPTVVQTENSYKSPNVSISVETVTQGEGGDKITYHVADIYIASPNNFRTCIANNVLQYYSVQDAMEMDADSGALIAISGDFYAYQKSGFLIRNGEVYSQDYTGCDICVMFEDGSVENYHRGEYDIDEIMSRGVSQVWNFGPSLLDEDGHVLPSYDVSTTVGYPNPRSAFGYYEPGHYCFIVVDGRQENYSKGMTIPELAQVFEGLGCASAYNLDGGGSALMTFNHERYSQQSNGGDRNLSDMLIIVETEGDK